MIIAGFTIEPGDTNISNLDSGMNAWTASGPPVVQLNRTSWARLEAELPVPRSPDDASCRNGGLTPASSLVSVFPGAGRSTAPPRVRWPSRRLRRREGANDPGKGADRAIRPGAAPSLAEARVGNAGGEAVTGEAR